MCPPRHSFLQQLPLPGCPFQEALLAHSRQDLLWPSVPHPRHRPPSPPPVFCCECQPTSEPGPRQLASGLPPLANPPQVMHAPHPGAPTCSGALTIIPAPARPCSTVPGSQALALALGPPGTAQLPPGLPVWAAAPGPPQPVSPALKDDGVQQARGTPGAGTGGMTCPGCACLSVLSVRVCTSVCDRVHGCVCVCACDYSHMCVCLCLCVQMCPCVSA